MSTHRISLVADAPLDIAIVKAWYQAVKTTGPSGITTTTQVHGEDGALTPVALVYSNEDRHIYSIPLTRDMTDEEAQAVVSAFDAVCEEDFDVFVSSPMSAAPETPLAVDADPLVALCSAWAKREHELWVKERTEAGWRYDPRLSLRDKTHPLLRPWDDLPAQNRQVDPTRPQELLDLLSDQGYVMVPKGELDAVFALLRGQ